MSDDAELARLFEQGLAQQRAGQHRAAIQIFHVVLKRGGASAAVHCHIAECYEQLRDPQRADSAYRAAIEIEPDAS
jgi:Tfp pilus assembly protein PilF